MPGFNIGGQGNGPSNVVEIHRQHRWAIQTFGDIRPDNEILIAESLQLPNVNIEEQIIQGALLSYKFAKVVKWDDATVTFYDTRQLLSRLQEWRDEVYTVESGLGTHTTYKKDSSFFLLDGEDGPTVELTLKNSWPKIIAHGPLSYGSSDLKIVTVTLSYDYAEQTL
jgi:hypothetical protein